MKTKLHIYSVMAIVVCLIGGTATAWGQTNYYSNGNQDVNDVNSWWTNTNGSGSHPTDFTTADQIFNVQNAHQMTASGTWTVSGIGSKVVIKTGGQITANGFDHSTTLDMESGATYIISSSYGSLTFGALNTNSNFQLHNSSGFDASRTYPNLIFNSGIINPISTALTINGNLTINNGAEFRGTTSGTQTHTIGGDVIINSGGIWTTTYGTGTPTYNIGGTINNSGTINAQTANGTSTINFTGSNSVNVMWGTVGGGDFNTLIASTKTVTLLSNLTLPSGTTFSISGTLDCGTYTLGGSGSTTVNSSATIYIGHADGLAGNIFTLGSNSFSAGAAYVYNGTVAQAISSYLPNNLTGTLKINNSNGVSLNRSLTITSGTLDLTSGDLKTRFGVSTIQNLSIGSTATLSNYSSNSFVDGPLIATLSSGTARTFPIGSGTTYRPITLNMSVGQDVTAEMFNSTPSGSFTGIGVDKISLVRYYSVSNATSSNCTVTLPWGGDDGVGDLANIAAVYGANGSIWLSYNRSGSTTGNASSGTVTGTFNSIVGADFTLGNKTGGTNPLPVETTSFTVVAQKMSAQLKWSTATEINNYGFEIERRQIAGSSRQKVGFVAGAGTSNSTHEYSFSDNDIAAGSFAYRLKQMDNNGSFKYSQEIQVTIEVPKIFSLNQNYPNPFNPTTIIEYQIQKQSFITLKIYDLLGQELVVLVNEKKEAGRYSVQWDATRFSSGIYFYRWHAGEFQETKRMSLIK
jgi:hypothetical protein